MNIIYFIILLFYLFYYKVIYSLNNYDISLSSTYNIILYQFKLIYLDKTKLKGYICSDKIYFMNMSIVSYFGCISLYKYNKLYYFNDINGILGLGFPTYNELYSTNIFTKFTLNITNKIFTLILNPFILSGILQLGGYDLNNIYPYNGFGRININSKFTLSVLPDCPTLTLNTGINNCIYRNFRVGISKIRFGLIILYYFLFNLSH